MTETSTARTAKWIVVSLLAMGCALSGSLASGQTIARFSGSGHGSSDSFEADGPWLLNWRATSEFPTLAHIEILLYEADSGRFVGVAVNYSGIGRGQKVIAEPGRYRIAVVGTFVDWSIQIEQAGRTITELLERNPDLERIRLVEPNIGLSRQLVSGIASWQAPDDGTLILRTQDGRRIRVAFYADEPCRGLSDAENIFFVTADFRAELFNAIVMEDGTRCYLGGVTPID